MDITSAQTVFFNHIKSKLPAHLSFVDEIAELLNISNDSAYRRIRGEKPIGLDEIQVLCNKYHVSLDQLLQIKNHMVVFSYDKVNYLSFGFNKYLEFVISNLELFNTLQNPRMYFNLKDILIFHFMPFAELRAFKFFFWKRTLMGYPELAKQQFDGDESAPETIVLAQRINELYAKVPATDIFNHESINVTISQIEFYRQANIFTGKDVLLKVYAQLEELINHLEMQAETGKKFLYNQPAGQSNVPYDAYINEILIGDNTIFVHSANRQFTFVNHTGLNYLSTQDKDFCDYTFKNMENIIRKSTHISMIGEKERSIYFNELRKKIRERMKSVY